MAKAGPINIPWRADFAIGWGIVGFSGLPAVKPWAFDDKARFQFNSPLGPGSAVPGNISFQQGIVSSAEHYERTIKAASSLNIKAWGAAVQGSADFLSNMEMSSKIVHYVVTSRFETTSLNVVSQQGVMPVLSPFAAELLTKVGPDEWAEQFGTHFIAGYVLGGLLVGKASFSCNNTGTAQSLKAGLEGTYGFFGGTSVSGGAQRQVGKEQHDSKIEYHCTGATLINDQPSDFEGLIAAARSYAQKNQGDKLQAILWPFSALDSYNRAEQLYSGARMPWSQQGRQLLKQLNLEHSRLQRLEHTIAMQKGLANSVAKKKVQRALRAFDRLESLADLAIVDEDAPDYDEGFYQRIFIAEEVEAMLVEDGSDEKSLQCEAQQLLTLAREQADLHNYKQALSYLNMASDLQPRDFDVLYHRGRVQDILEDFGAAIVDLDTALRIRPASGPCLMLRGQVKSNMENYVGAVADLDTALLLQPDDADILYLRGLAKFELENNAGALLDLDQAQRLRETDVDILRLRGEIKVEMERFMDALEDLQAAERLSANDFYTIFLMGRCQLELHEIKKALELLNKADSLKPNDANTLWHRGLAKDELNDYRGVLQDIDAACQLDPEAFATAESHRIRAFAHNELKDYEDALCHIDEAIEMDPEDVNYFTLRANIKLELGDAKGRREDLHQAERLKTGDVNARYRGSGSCTIS